MTRKPSKPRTARPRAAEAPRGSNTLRNRAIMAAVLMTGLAVAIWYPRTPAERAPAKVAAASAPAVAMAAPAPAPVKRAPEPAPALAPSPAFTTASLTSVAAVPLPPTPPQPSRMPAILEADFDAWLIESYKACYSPPPATPDGDPYLARVRVALKSDGALAGSPRLVNPPWDPAWRAHADAAVKAVKSCDPLHVPDKYAPYYSQWKTKTVFFDPTRS